jgi:hypothetical protein
MIVTPRIANTMTNIIATISIADATLRSGSNDFFSQDIGPHKKKDPPMLKAVPRVYITAILMPPTKQPKNENTIPKHL